jgi:hypothetical protein
LYDDNLLSEGDLLDSIFLEEAFGESLPLFEFSLDTDLDVGRVGPEISYIISEP